MVKQYRHKWVRVKGEPNMRWCTKCGVVANVNEIKRGGRQCLVK